MSSSRPGITAFRFQFGVNVYMTYQEFKDIIVKGCINAINDKFAQGKEKVNHGLV